MKSILFAAVLLLFASGCSSTSLLPVKYWNLPGDSHIAYINVPSRDSLDSVPLIFLHGGPGAYQVSSFEIGRKWYKHLSGMGFDVYIYDQAGSGLSSRSSNPLSYTVKRHVDDLEAIRVLIGKEKIILVGDSWGAALAANYMAAYPGKVIKAIFTSPGPIDHELWDLKSSTPRLPLEFLSWVRNKYGDGPYWHYVKLDLLLQENIDSAYNYAGDKEMDKQADSFLNEIILDKTVYDTQKLEESGLKFNGAGWWAMIMTLWDATNNKEPAAPKLSADETPVLILRGDADYLQEEIAENYTAVFRNSRLIRIPMCGHLIWLERPDIYCGELETFLMAGK